MKTLRLPGFVEAGLGNAVYKASDACKEYFVLEGINAQVFVFGYEPGYEAEPHTHEEVRLTLVRQGRLQFSLEGESYDLGPGDMMCIMPGASHGFRSTGDDPVQFVEFVVTAAEKGGLPA